MDSSGSLVPQFVFGLVPAELAAVFPSADSVPVHGVILALKFLAARAAI